MSREHLLRRARSDQYPTNIVCLAVEKTWVPLEGKPEAERATLERWVAVGSAGAAGVYGKERWFEGNTATSFWECLRGYLRRKQNVYIYCERASLVCALLDLWGLTERREVDLCGADERNVRGGGCERGRKAGMRIVLEDPPFIVEGKVRGTSGKFKVLDIANYGLQPLPEDTPGDALARRAFRFVAGMVAALQLRTLGSLKDTAGTQAMYSFRRAHLTHPVFIHDNARALNLEGDSYYGGRCEAFRIGRVRGPVYHLDVSSMYPYVAANNPVPVSLAGFLEELPAGDHPQLGEGCGVIADVTVETDEPAYPYRDTGRNITIWPIGVFRTVLSQPELQDALSRDRVIRWHRAAWYRMEPALASYAKCTLEMREQHKDNDDLKTWCKALGVCLIGKLGQKQRFWEDSDSNCFHGPWQTWWEYRKGEGWKRFRSISGYTQAETVSSWCYDAAPAIASWVTSMARIFLLSMARCAGWSEVYYCDTDALMVSSAGYSRLSKAGYLSGDGPGKLRIKNVSEYVEIHGVKAYDEAERSVRAGRPLSRAPSVEGQARYWTHSSPATAPKEFAAPQALRTAVRYSRVMPYQHGEVCANGEVVPFQLNEG